MERAYSRMARSGTGVDKLLGELEGEVMALLWERGIAPVREIAAELNAARQPGHHLAYTTVMTVMARLAEKGLLHRTRVGKAHHYAVAETREAFLARSAKRLTEQMVRDFGEVAVASFVAELEHVAPGRLEELRRRVMRHDEQ